MRIILDHDGEEGILVKDFEMRDPVVMSLLDQYGHAEMQQRCELFADMVEIGARMIQRQQDGQQGDLLRREVERLESVVVGAQEQIARQGVSDFSVAMTEVMSVVSQQLASLGGKLDGALAVAAKEADLQAERERGTAKGRMFEQEVGDYVDHIANILGDSATATGDMGGITGRAGDVVVQVGNAGGAPKGSIVFEAKTGRLSKPEAMRELDRAIQGRGADFGVLVVADRTKVPANTYELREYGGNKLICVFDDIIGNAGLEMAYSLARARVLINRRESSGVDPALALAALERAVQAMDMVRQVKLKMTAVQAAADESKNILDAMIEDVKFQIAAAVDALGT
jgi:hypothetical protein